MSLTTPFRVQKLQTALHAKAKESPNFRFHALYDKVYRKDVLAYAYERCKANGGAAGVDGQTFENIEAYGRERWLDELAQELKSRTGLSSLLCKRPSFLGVAVVFGDGLQGKGAVPLPLRPRRKELRYIMPAGLA